MWATHTSFTRGGRRWLSKPATPGFVTTLRLSPPTGRSISEIPSIKLQYSSMGSFNGRESLRSANLAPPSSSARFLCTVAAAPRLSLSITARKLTLCIMSAPASLRLDRARSFSTETAADPPSPFSPAEQELLSEMTSKYLGEFDRGETDAALATVDGMETIVLRCAGPSSPFLAYLKVLRCCI